MKRIAALFLALGMVLAAGCAKKDQDGPSSGRYTPWTLPWC